MVVAVVATVGVLGLGWMVAWVWVWSRSKWKGFGTSAMEEARSIGNLLRRGWVKTKDALRTVMLGKKRMEQEARERRPLLN